MKSKRLCLSGSRDQQHEDKDGEESKDRCSRTLALSQSESCPICLNSLPAEVGFPEYCYHAFCLSCILKWSETSTSCPVDRRPFKTIYKLNPDGGCTKINVVARSPRESVCCSCNLCQWCCMKSKIHFRMNVKKETATENTDNCPTKGCKDTEDKSELELRNQGWENLCFLGGNGGDFLVQSDMTPLNSTEIEDANELCLIQRKREGLKHVRLPTVLQRIEGHASLSVESVICLSPSLDEYIFPLRPLSIRNKDFPKRTCVHSRAQDGTEKKQPASSSKGSRKKNVQPSTRRRSTRNSRSDVSPLQSSPKSSNSDNDAAGRNNSSSSTNAPSSEQRHKPPAKQRKRAPKKAAQTRKRLRSAAQTQEESNESRENSDSETDQESKKAKVTDESSDTALSEVKLSDAVSTEKEYEQEDSFLALSPVGQSTDEPIPDSPPVLSVENIDEESSASLELQNTPPSPSFTNGQTSLEKSDPTSKSERELDSDVLDTEQHLCTEEDSLQSDNMQDSEGECQGSPASVKYTENARSPSSRGSENESLTHEKPLTPSVSPEHISDFKEPTSPDIGQAEVQSSESLNKNQSISSSPSKSENVADSEDETKVEESLSSPAVDLEKRFSSEHSPASCDSSKENASETDDLPKVQSVESPMQDSSSATGGCDDKQLNGLEVSLQEPSLTDTKTCSSVESEHICSTDISANKTQLPEDNTVKEFGDSAEVQASTLCSDGDKDLPVKSNRTESFADLSIIEDGSKMPGSDKVSDSQSEKQVAFSEDNNESVAMECDSVCSDGETETEFAAEKTEDSLEEPSSSASAKEDEPSSSVPAKDDKPSSSISKKEDEPSSSVSAKQETESPQKPPVPPGEEASKKEPRPRRSRFHSPSTTWSPSKNDIKERQKSRSRSKNRDSPSKPKSRSRSREKDRNHSEQWKGRSRDRHHRRQSRSKSRSRSRSGSRTTNRSKTNTVERTDKGSPPWRERRPNDWKSPRGMERNRRNEPEKPNEHFRTDKYDSRVSSEPYMENKNDYPDWVAERIRSTENRGREDGWMRVDGRGRGWGDNRGRGDGRGRGENWTRGDYRGRGDFRGRGDRGRGEGRGGRGGNRGRGSPRSSHWEDNQFNSGDSWSRNVNMDWNSPRGRGSRGRGGFRGGFNYGDQHENSWNTRQPYSGNANTSGLESSRPQEHKNYKPKYEETFESPVDRSGWTSASSWAVRKTLPADVQNYYSKRGRNSTGNQPGWNKPETSQDQDQALKDQPSQQTENAQMPVNIVQPPMNVAPPQPMNPPPQPMNPPPQPMNPPPQPMNPPPQPMNPPPQPMNPPPQAVNMYPYNVGVPPPIVNIHHNPYNIHPQLPMHLHPAMPLVQVSAPPSNVPQGLPPPPPPPPPSQQVSYVTPQQEVKPLQDGHQRDAMLLPHGNSSRRQIQANPIISHVNNTTSNAPPPLSAPPVTQGIMGASMARSPVSMTISSHVKNPHISVKPSPWREPITVEASADSSNKEKKILIQERAALEVKGAIKQYYQNKDITKDEYKEIVKKAVDKVCHSKSGEVDSAKVANLVKAYVDKYKHSRKKGPDDRL